MLVMDRTADRDELVKCADETGQCPFDDCEGSIECVSTHERDSSNDYYVCRSCGWRYSQLELWSLERGGGQ